MELKNTFMIYNSCVQIDFSVSNYKWMLKPKKEVIMVNSMSGVSFGSIGAMDKVSQEQLYSPGAYSMPELGMQQPPPYKKKGGFIGFLSKLVLTAAVVGGGAVAANKFIPQIKNAKLLKDLPAEGAKKMDKVYGRIKQFGEWVEKTVVGLFTKKPKVDEAKAGVDDAAKAGADDAAKATNTAKPADAPKPAESPKAEAPKAEPPKATEAPKAENKSEPKLIPNS